MYRLDSIPKALPAVLHHQVLCTAVVAVVPGVTIVRIIQTPVRLH